MSDASGLRIDKWLWQARFFKSRTLAATFVHEGRLRLNGAPTAKAHALVRPGDVLTFALGPHIRVIEVAQLGARRGPASEARSLYIDRSPPISSAPAGPPPVAERPKGAGRPTKRDRRALDRLTGED